MANAPVQAQAPCCPRCAYDQSGVMATWNDACPLSGICSECGLTFAWLDVLRPRRNDLPWFYEHAPGWALHLRRAWRTWPTAARPNRFWSRVKLASRLHPLRALAWPFLIYLCAHALHAVTWTIWTLVRCYALTVTYPGAAGANRSWWPNWIEYFEPWVGPVLRFENLPRGRRLVLATDLTHVVPGAISMLAATATVPLMLMVLSSSRRISKIRPAHILRATAFGVAWIGVFPLVWVIYYIEDLLRQAFDQRPYFGPRTNWTISIMRDWWPLVAAAFVAWFCWWWYMAIVRGFQLHRARVVWSLLMIAAALAALIPALLHPDIQWWMAKWSAF